LTHVGVSELLLLFVIGLLILGPDRLPRIATQIGRWVGRARRTANQLRYQLEREITLAEQEKAREQKQKSGVRPEARPDVAGARPDVPGPGTAAPAPAPVAAPAAGPDPSAPASPEERIAGRDAMPPAAAADPQGEKIRQA
jgi:sec-independent protein translocase protein TatB